MLSAILLLLTTPCLHALTYPIPSTTALHSRPASRPEWELDRDRIRDQRRHCAGDCAAPRDCGAWAAAVPDVYRAPQSCDEGDAVRETFGVW